LFEIRRNAMKETRFIEEIRKMAGRPGRGVKTGIGDDCAVLGYDDKRYLLWAADMLVQGTHFRRKDGYKKIGRKAVAVNISDIAAMGGVPRYITVSLGIPRYMEKPAVKALYDGIFRICREYGIKVIGGDTNRSGRLVIDVSILGTVEKERLVTRSGAYARDLILITGPVRNGKKEHLRFSPRLEESRFITGNYKVNSMIDVSDGIAMDAARICAESGVGCKIYAGAIPLSGKLSLEDALYYGESFELLFTMRPREAERLIRDLSAKERKAECFVIGEITGKKQGLRLVDRNGRASNLKVTGYRHL
jgi:thiamine-monophosphate kinase